MFDLSSHPYFRKWQDPQSGAVSYILTERVAPIQLPFYFTNPSITENCDFLWFYAAFPPCQQRFLGVLSLNPEQPDIQWFPQAMFNDASPMIAPDGSGVYFASGSGVFFIAPNGKWRLIGKIPEEYIDNRFLYRFSTHLSISADGEWLFLDGEVGMVCFAALMHVHTGEFKLLHEFSYRHNHGAFSPIDPKLILFPRDWRRTPETGRYESMEQRLWVMDTDQTFYRNLRPDVWEGHGHDTAHEWWSRDGLVCYVDYQDGVYECDPCTLKTEHVWKRPICHAHCNPARELYCADQSPYSWQDKPVEVLFYNRKTGKEQHIVTAMPKPPDHPRFPYHLDPHPQFSPDGSMIDYMTTVLGRVDIAIAPVDQFLQ